MKFLIFFITILIVSTWMALSVFLLGVVEVDGITLSLPKTTAEFSDSTGVLNGLLSSFAVVLALIAVLLQGRALKESTAAQNEQADALKKQLEHQQDIIKAQLDRSQAIANQLAQQQVANSIMILQAKQQYHSSEVSRMDGILNKIEGNKEKSDLFNSCLAKKNEHISDLNKIKH